MYIGLANADEVLYKLVVDRHAHAWEACPLRHASGIDIKAF